MRWVKYIDRISEWTGIAAAWITIPLMLVVMYEVILRYFFNLPTEWGYDVLWMLFGVQFMIGGAYTLLHDGHVRIDIVYDLLSPRGKRIFDAVVYVVFFLLVMIILTYAGVKFAAQAWSANEYLSTTSWHFPSGPIKTVIPVAYFLLGLQSVAELIRKLSVLMKKEEKR